ncbi:hypothetical protein Smic_73290 [Streptomyces microflavus]|uniref:Carrier domain-containing protein n=1 Tax=Streptomyces microflavus TaxID=1919 RepID=A0A7J0D1Z6_STRMI|nr:hypothetical protein Smic_73290 [Streptomyces microflavus]
MIPSYFVELPALPLTANGKVDTAALPAPRAETGERPHEEPVTLYEISVARHWKTLLGLEQVGLEDDFFEVGGSSIKLIELLHHLRTEFGVSVPVSRLYQVTTLHGMAATMQEVLHSTSTDELPYLTFNSGQAPHLFCFPPAGGHGLVYRGLAAQLPEYAVIGFNYLPGDDKVARYADLIEAARPEGRACSSATPSAATSPSRRPRSWSGADAGWATSSSSTPAASWSVTSPGTRGSASSRPNSRSTCANTPGRTPSLAKPSPTPRSTSPSAAAPPTPERSPHRSA